MTVNGVVQDEDGTPIQGATVTLLESNRSVLTDVGGAFVFEGLPVGFHLLRADAPNFRSAEATAKPSGDKETVSLVMVLMRFAEEPYHQSVQFQGVMQCAAEYVIITPNCDEWTRFVGVPVFEGETIFQHPLYLNWRTIVLDMDFDESSQPGMDGLRITVRGTTDKAETGSYEQYARLYGSDTYRMEPGQSFEDGTGPVPQNATTFEYQVYPHSHAYHPAGAGVLGVAFGLDVQFDLFATAFYVDPAPADWSILA